MLTRIKAVLRFFYSLPLLDGVSTLFAMSYGGQETYEIPAFFIRNWGSVGLVGYEILLFIILLAFLELLVIRTLSIYESQKVESMSRLYRIVGKMLMLSVIFLACGIASYWLSVVFSNFTLPLFLDVYTQFIVDILIVCLSALVLSLFIRVEVLEFWRQL